MKFIVILRADLDEDGEVESVWPETEVDAVDRWDALYSAILVNGLYELVPQSHFWKYSSIYKLEGLKVGRRRWWNVRRELFDE